MVLIPMELMAALKVGIIIIPTLFLITFFLGSREGWANGMNHGLLSVLAILVAILAGAILTPLLLPWLPGRAFSVKGFSIGGFGIAALMVFCWNDWVTWAGRLEILAWLFFIPAASAYLAMNFTGASTFTSLSGVRKEMRWALPLEIGAGMAGLVLWLGSNFIA
jgi:acetyl-CoA decarbonylase/synthase complex subunit gamma